MRDFSMFSSYDYGSPWVARFSLVLALAVLFAAVSLVRT
jgi:hypothetical protein